MRIWSVARSVQHSRSPAKGASTTACEAGTPTPFVRCNALFCGVPALLVRLFIALATHWDPPGAGAMAEAPLAASAN